MNIEKQIPFGLHGNRKYDFSQLDIGDSVLLDNKKLRYAIYSALRWYNNRNNTTIRIMTRKEGHTVRFWRTA
jgi:hypothetical protein